MFWKGIQKFKRLEFFQLRGVPTATKTAAYTVLPTDSGKVLIANNGSSQVDFTLPTPAAASGCIFLFANIGAAGMKIISGTVDTIVTFNDAAADDVSYETATEMIGAACMIYSNGTNFYHFEMSGATVTITT